MALADPEMSLGEPRAQLERLLETALSIGRPRLIAPRLAEIDQSLHVIGLADHGGFETSGRLMAVTLLLMHQTQVVVGIGEFRFQGNRRLVRSGGALKVAAIALNQAEIEAKQRAFGNERRRPANTRQGGRDVAALMGQQTEEVQRVGVVRLALEDPTVVVTGLIEAPGLMMVDRDGQ